MQALRRQISSGTYDPDRPVIVPDPRGQALPLLDRLENLPEANAVIIYMMDVSGSMTDEQKEIVRTEASGSTPGCAANTRGSRPRYIIHDAVAQEVDETPSTTPARRAAR